MQGGGDRPEDEAPDAPPSPIAAAAAGLESRMRPVMTAALVGGLTGAALAGAAILGGRLWRARRRRETGDAPPE